MTNFQKALENKKNNLINFITASMKTAADIGCGNGIDSIVLTSFGLRVTGFDPSSKMIEKAVKNSKHLKQKIDFYNYAAKDIPEKFNTKFDFICSLGNTIANISPKDLELTIKRFSELLKGNGKMLLHILNYEKIIQDNERIINIKNTGDDYIIRFYDFEKDYLKFNILRFKKNNTAESNLITTKLFPHKLETIKKLLKINGFDEPDIYADLSKTNFSTILSKDIYLFCSKS